MSVQCPSFIQTCQLIVYSVVPLWVRLSGTPAASLPIFQGRRKFCLARSFCCLEKTLSKFFLQHFEMDLPIEGIAKAKLQAAAAFCQQCRMASCSAWGPFCCWVPPAHWLYGRLNSNEFRDDTQSVWCKKVISIIRPNECLHNACSPLWSHQDPYQ